MSFLKNQNIKIEDIPNNEKDLLDLSEDRLMMVSTLGGARPIATYDYVNQVCRVDCVC
jgi:hypothetical protein